MPHCLRCHASLGTNALIRIWTLRPARCHSCGAGHAPTLPRSARLFIQGFVGVTYGLTVIAGTALGRGLLESTSAYLLGFMAGTVVLVLPFALTERLAVELVDEAAGSLGQVLK